MGADGRIYIVRAAEWEANFPDIRADEVGLWSMIMLGIPVLLSYSDSNDIDHLRNNWNAQCLAETVRTNLERAKYLREKHNGTYRSSYGVITTSDALEAEAHVLMQKPEYEHSKRCLEAVDWFEAHAEEHEVWT